jgi:hypothetical protein
MYMFFLSKTQPIQNGEDLLSDDDSTVSSEEIDVKTQFRVISETVVIEEKNVPTSDLVSKDSLLKTEHVKVTVETKTSVVPESSETKSSVVSEPLVSKSVVPETVVEEKSAVSPSETAQVSSPPPLEENKNRWSLSRFMCWRQ